MITSAVAYRQGWLRFALLQPCAVPSFILLLLVLFRVALRSQFGAGAAAAAAAAATQRMALFVHISM